MTDPVSSALAGQITDTVKKETGKESISQSEFLTLFVTQLQHQDPLSPLEPDQLTAQLAQFASLEQLTGVNTRLDQLSVLSQQGLLSLMGRQVAFAGDTVGVSGGAASAVGYDLDAAAARVVATVRAADGSVVRVQDLGGQDAGHHEFKFDGKDAKGGVVPDGQYHVEIAAAANAGDAPKQLDLTVREALTFFSSSPKVLRRLQVLDEIGLGYLRLGQPATTLSGGEAQRIKIAAHLSSHGGERLLYILDEPTTGLHFDDIAKLLTAFRKLLEAGHTLVVIEHNLDVIKTADYIIDLGPEGGEDGGTIVATGTPEQLAQVEASHTGRYLRPVLAEGRSHAYAAGR